MQCQKCGASLPDHFKFCIKCGDKIAVNEAQPQPQYNQAMGQQPQPQYNQAMGQQPQPQYNQAAGQQQSSGKHFSLEDIARQQEEKKDIGFSSTPSQLPEEQYNEGGEENVPSLDSEGQSVLGKQTSYQSQPSPRDRQSADSVLLYSVSSPAVPLGNQKQTCIPLFDKDTAQKLAALKNN